MTVEEIKGLNGDYDNFPVGMRVLAVDDDPICLKVLETTLRKCQYQVTTTSQARVALRMLRENRDRFDLIISDVQMPDMDGFKLLELVGLEMDLPVIMLSAYSDPKLVMKGVTHGACDYLVKPVRIEELRNIWQHVIRKKKIEPKHQNQNQNGSPDQETFRQGNPEGGPGGSFTNSGGGGDQNGKPNKKRKDENNENEDNDNENEDPSTQKKPRVVWSPELHRKFVSAVEHLGIEKAVPKRILDMMNVEGISRENVASHLQKYRLYLKRISSQQGNRISSLDGFGDFRGYAVPGRLTNTILSPYSQTGILPRLNSPNGLNLHSFNSPSLIPQNHGQSFSNPINTFGKFNPLIIPGNQKENLAQGSFNVELDQFHHNNNSRMFTTGGPLSNSLTNCVPNGGGFVNQGSFNNGSFNPQLANFPALTESLGNVRENHSSTMANLINPLEYSATNSVSGVSDVSLRRGLNGQEGFIQNVNQRQGVLEQNYVNNSDNMFGNLNTRLLGNNGSQNLDQMNMRCFNGDGLQAIELEKITTEIGSNQNQESLLDYTKPGQDYDLDDLIKREHDGAMLDGQFVFDSAFPFGQCLGDS